MLDDLFITPDTYKSLPISLKEKVETWGFDGACEIANANYERRESLDELFYYHYARYIKSRRRDIISVSLLVAGSTISLMSLLKLVIVMWFIRGDNPMQSFKEGFISLAIGFIVIGIGSVLHRTE
jgi:hypothetical protein